MLGDLIAMPWVRVIAFAGCILVLASCGGNGGSGSKELTKCARIHAVGVHDLAVQDISCTEARRLANSSGRPERSDLADAGFTCTKTGEGAGYTAWRCVSPDATFTFRFYADD